MSNWQTVCEEPRWVSRTVISIATLLSGFFLLSFGLLLPWIDPKLDPNFIQHSCTILDSACSGRSCLVKIEVDTGPPTYTHTIPELPNSKNIVCYLSTSAQNLRLDPPYASRSWEILAFAVISSLLIMIGTIYAIGITKFATKTSYVSMIFGKLK